MVDKLSRENNDLKKQIELLKKGFKSKLDDFRLLIGLEVDLELLLKAKSGPNTKEMQALKFYIEAKERAETLGRMNHELDKKYQQLQGEIEQLRNEKD